MERQPLLDAEDSRFWARMRRRLLLVFWITLAVMLGVAIGLILHSYQRPAPALWYQQRPLCAITNQTASRQMMKSAALLGCGGIITRLQDESDSARSLVTEGRHYDLRILLDIWVSPENNGSQIQEAVRRWIGGGVSGFLLSGSSRDAVMTVSDLLWEELDGDGGYDRIILLPDWLCEENVNKSRLLRTCLLSDWRLLDLNNQSGVMRTAWKVLTENSRELLPFIAATLPGTIILPLSQTEPPPSWLRPLLLLRSQSPALYTGWLQPLSDNSTYSFLCQWRCSTLLVTLNPSNETACFSWHRPHYTPAASLLLSTHRGRNRAQTLQEEVLLEPGEAQVLRLKAEEL